MLFPLCLLLACSGNETGGSPQSAAAPATDKKVIQTTSKSPGEAPTPTLHAVQASHTGPVPGPTDPPWFKPDLFPGAKVTSSGRTQKDEQGLFASQMLLALPAGTTREACVDALMAAVSGSIPTLDQQPGQDRVTLTGSNDDYHVTMLCGESKGTMSAYVSYRWLRPPT
ncbi:MAG TPA: hypothetical protein VGB85_19200 [Nannocystis sp.]|jgi:hypothetical protein